MILKNILLKVLLFSCLFCLSPVNSQAFEINFNFTTQDIKERNFGKVLLGGVLSLAVHETGHFIAGRALGMNTKFAWNNGPAVMANNFYDQSETDRAIFAVAGMLSQSIVGTVMTTYANDSDYTLGFNSFSAVTNLTYPLRDKETSDWKHMPHGKLISVSNGLYQSALVGFNTKLFITEVE